MREVDRTGAASPHRVDDHVLADALGHSERSLIFGGIRDSHGNTNVDQAVSIGLLSLTGCDANPGLPTRFAPPVRAESAGR